TAICQNNITRHQASTYMQNLTDALRSRSNPSQQETFPRFFWWEGHLLCPTLIPLINPHQAPDEDLEVHNNALHLCDLERFLRIHLYDYFTFGMYKEFYKVYRQHGPPPNIYAQVESDILIQLLRIKDVYPLLPIEEDMIRQHHLHVYTNPRFPQLEDAID